ncbi:hypothetical protein LI064_17335 [Clostridium perfringens]|uniref:hypothetical protein n=1 Tax=Clostridium perfringens TaxID=1502 RepID=UPI0022456409|nr:hypothetical protein [Clostridium perfringens]MCX0356268.1 hypothetical protein [Clostridium perfringens]
MSKTDILFNSKKFFDELSEVELTKLLKEFNFEYEDINFLPSEVREDIKSKQIEKINNYHSKL